MNNELKEKRILSLIKQLEEKIKLTWRLRFEDKKKINDLKNDFDEIDNIREDIKREINLLVSYKQDNKKWWQKKGK